MEDADWSVVVMDSAFNKLNEVVFPGKIYRHNRLIITPFGLLVVKIYEGKPFEKNKTYNYDIFRF